MEKRTFPSNKLSHRNVFIGVGSNIGDRFHNIKQAITLLQSNNSIHVLKYSSLYETEPWGKQDQNWFYNLVMEINTLLSSHELLRFLKVIEESLNNEEKHHWGPRTIDLDILFYHHLVIDINYLKIPHKHLINRKFVLVPLNEIAPKFIHPVYKKSIKTLLATTDDKYAVKMISAFSTEVSTSS